MNEAQKQVALIQANAHTFKQPARAVEDNTNPTALSSIDEIFTRLKAIGSVGNAFKTPQEEAIVKQEWMLALREEGVTKQSMIDDGIDLFRVKARKARGTTWFPSIGEFIDMCLGSNDSLEYAERALKLFNRSERQICTVGKMLVGEHHFNLKKLPAKESNKLFIDLYLELAKNNDIEPLEAFALTETVQLSKEQQKDADNRKQEAQNRFFKQFGRLAEDISKDNSVKPVKVVSKGVQKGSLKVKFKSPRKLEEEKQRQLESIQGMLK
jgi:hypothetical protein